MDAQDAKTLLEAKDTRIRNLESLLRDRDNEIQELRSHLDMFQSVFPFSNPVSPTAATLSSLHHAVSVSFRRPSPPSGQNLVAKSLTSLLDGIARPRKQRAQGISAEPQSLSTIQELSQKKFPTYPKNDRYVTVCNVTGFLAFFPSFLPNKIVSRPTFVLYRYTKLVTKYCFGNNNVLEYIDFESRYFFSRENLENVENLYI